MDENRSETTFPKWFLTENVSISISFSYADLPSVPLEDSALHRTSPSVSMALETHSIVDISSGPHDVDGPIDPKGLSTVWVAQRPVPKIGWRPLKSPVCRHQILGMMSLLYPPRSHQLRRQ